MGVIRFDETTGRLEGTSLPAIPDLIAAMKANDWRAYTGIVWMPRRRCGCVLGLVAKLHSPDYGEDDRAVTADAGRVVGLTFDESYSVAFGFDSPKDVRLTNFQDARDQALATYGCAARAAMEAADLMFS